MAAAFNSIHRHGYLRVAVAVPVVSLSNPAVNQQRILELAKQAQANDANLVLFPELSLSGYSNDDLFQQEAMLAAVLSQLEALVQASHKLKPLLIVGAPLRFEGKLFNCAVVIHAGAILGIVPKSYLPNYREFYEKRQFAAARDAIGEEVQLFGNTLPFGNQLLFQASNLEHCVVHCEICEDLWTAAPPSSQAALAGATLLTNLSASNITLGKGEYRRALCAGQSGRTVAAYLYAAAGYGESTTDLAWDGHALIYENGDLLAESERFQTEAQLLFADVDLQRLAQERMRLSSFNDSVHDARADLQSFRRIEFNLALSKGELPLQRVYPRYPFVPADAAKRNERCFEAYNIQVAGLMQRLQSSGIERVVIGVSGGLDSTQALLVAANTMDRMGLPRSNILAYSMPGFATSEHTRSNAWTLMESLKVSAAEIDIRPSCMQMLKDLGHPYADGEALYDITFENVQAGERSSHLFRLANHQAALVLGTGDLSELALGWCTYGVGDQMSHYNVNTSVPKTLIQYLIRWLIASKQFDASTAAVLQSIVDTEISPELVPGDDGADAAPAQRTEDVIGPYALQDFNIYFSSRFGFAPSKIAFMAQYAWGEVTRGDWPADVPERERVAYDLPTICKWLEVFLRRFYGGSQFKRSAMPNGPKVGSGGSLSPRGDWRAPSDANAEVWLAELRTALDD